jgi:hypothetical protein
VRGEKATKSASTRPQKRRKTPHFSEYENKVKKQNAFAQLLRWRTEYFSSLLGRVAPCVAVWDKPSGERGGDLVGVVMPLAATFRMTGCYRPD